MNHIQSYSSAAGPFAVTSLTYDDSSETYLLAGTDGTAETFNSSGQLTIVTDNDGNRTQYGFSSIPAISGQRKASYRASYCVILCP